MRVLLILTFLLIQSFNLHADAGLAFRYKVEIQNENEIITGYIYHYTYSNGYVNENESFFEYFLREFKNEPFLYKEIHNLKLSEEFKLDFSLTKNRLKLNIENITNIKLLEEKEITTDEEVVIINNEEIYNLIGKKSFNKEQVYHPISENCSFKIIDFTKKKNIQKIKTNLQSLVVKHFNNETESYYKEFYKSLNVLRNKLFKEKVLIFEYCDAL